MARPSRFQLSLDLFTADAAFVRMKELAPMMGTSWFSLSKNPRFDPIVHEYDKYRVSVESRSEHGIATIWDNDILIFLISQIAHASNEGNDTSPRIQFTGYDFFRFLRREWRGGITGKHSYELLLRSLRRLQGTFINTNIKPHGDIETGGIEFYWISHLEHLQRRSNADVGYEVYLDPKIHEWATAKDSEGKLSNILTLDSHYFDITSGLEKWLYLWARKSASWKHDGFWQESFELLREKSATTRGSRQFRHHLRQIIKRNAMPGYDLMEITTPKGPSLGVSRRQDSSVFMSPKEIDYQRQEML